MSCQLYCYPLEGLEVAERFEVGATPTGLLFQSVFERAYPGFTEGAFVVEVVLHIGGAGGLPLGDRHLLEQILFGAALGG
jgi:hypothetical protein